MPLLVLSFLVCKVVAQFLVQSSSNSGSVTPNSCLRRSVQVYTSDSSTFIVTDMGSTSFMATPTFCANISTIYEANGTVTVTQTAKATVSWATATEVVAAGFTKYFNETVAELSTTTTTITSTASITTTLLQPSLVYETATAITTAFITQTALSISISSLLADTLTTTEESTLLLTTTQPGTTEPASTVVTTLPPLTITVTPSPITETDVPPASTEIQTSLVYSTETETSYISVTLAQATQSISYPVTLPQATFTPLPQTTYVTITLAPSTITSTVSVTPPASTLYQTLTATAPTQTLQLTTSLPKQTETLQLTTSLLAQTQTLQLTSTLPAQTQTLDLTTTLQAQTQTFTPPASTIFGTITTTLFGPTVTETDTYSSSVSSSRPEAPTFVPTPTASGVPALALASPTVIAGDPVNGSPTDYDDVVWPVSLSMNLTLYGQSSPNIYVSSNGALGIQYLDEEYTNQRIPYFGYSGCTPGVYSSTSYNTNATCFSDTAALGLWDDLFIYAGTQQGIYYETDGTSPNQVTTFEFYLDHCCEDVGAYYHFLIKFFEARPNIVTFKYLNVSDHGVGGTVGVQSLSAGIRSLEYSYNQAIIYPGLQLTFDTTGYATGNGTIHTDAPGNAS